MGEFEKVYELNKAIHLPVCLNDIEITEEEWEETMNRIPDMSDVAHYPYRVTRDMLVKAMNELDMRNKKQTDIQCGILRILPVFCKKTRSL